MKSVTVLVVLFVLLVSTAQAADVWLEIPAADAYTSGLDKGNLNADIKLFMKGQKTPGVAQKYGEFQSNKRSNAFGKGKENACQMAFLSAIIALQQRAVREGGNAVIDIYSNTKNQVYESAEKFKCISGAMTANVSLKGTVVKLK